MAGVKGENDNDGDYARLITGSLARADSLGALYSGYRALRSALAKELRRRPWDAGLIGAHLGAALLQFSLDLPEYKPLRPRGCPSPPRPEDLIAAFENSMRDARQERPR
jgi:hypothetical protein